MPAVVGAVQGLEADQGACRFAHGGGLGCGNPGQPHLAQAAKLAHAQAQGRVAGQGNRGVAQAHIAGDRQACQRLGQTGRVQAKLFEQGGRVVGATAYGVSQGLDKPDRKIAQAHRQRLHGITTRD